MIPAIEETGFQPIFDGKSLDGWDGDPNFWRVENGAIVGQTTADQQPEQNIFLIWRGGSPADFELKLQFKLTGRQQRHSDPQRRTARYQVGHEGLPGRYGRRSSSTPARFTKSAAAAFWRCAASSPTSARARSPRWWAPSAMAKSSRALIKGEDWNDLHIIARGNTLIQLSTAAS